MYTKRAATISRWGPAEKIRDPGIILTRTGGWGAVGRAKPDNPGRDVDGLATVKVSGDRTPR